MLTGSSQKALWQVYELYILVPWANNATGGQRGPNPSGCSSGTW